MQEEVPDISYIFDILSSFDLTTDIEMALLVGMLRRWRVAGLRQLQYGDPLRVPQSSHRQHVRLRLRNHFRRLRRTSDRLDERPCPPSRRPTGLLHTV